MKVQKNKADEEERGKEWGGVVVVGFLLQA